MESLRFEKVLLTREEVMHNEQGWRSINAALSMEHQAENKAEVRVEGASEFPMELGLGLGNMHCSGQNI